MPKRLIGFAAVAAACLLASPALAIPSPELIVGSLSSLSQIGAVLAATLGGGALLAGAKSQAAQSARRAWRVVAVLGVIASGLTAALFWQIASQADERRSRLEANLLRPARQPGQAVADPSLKELSYREQVDHPLGITTASAAMVLAEMHRERETIIVDARNDAEVEMGGLPAPRSLRLSEFRADDPAHAGKRFVFFCHNGNRSYESCEAARAKGIDCRFMIGGLEKWVVERRPITGLQNRSLDQLRAIPEYPNNGRLLDTAEVKALVADKGAQFVDVRYPGEFEKFHLPGAVNITLRRMTRDEKIRAFSSLPKAPVILPCYDRRSCFFAEVMGLDLHRAGFQVEGRYTVPHEYFIASPRPPHVEAFLADAKKTYWQHAREALAAGLARAAETIGLPLALLLLALASRLAILPFAMKSERDQIVARATASEVTALKSHLADDPVRLRRALMAHASHHNLTPVRNLVALLFLPVLALAVLAAGDAAILAPTRLSWLPSLAAPDPVIALPLVFALLMSLYCIASFAQTSRQRLTIGAFTLPLFAILAVPLPAAASLYLTFSATLLVFQRLWVTHVPRRLWASVKDAWRETMERRLGGARLLDVPHPDTSIGNKAARLAVLAAKGFPVPRALVLDHVSVSALLASPPRAQRRITSRMARALGGSTFAVRSSAAGEDGAASTFAGVFDSVLDVPRNDLPAAIRRVAASFAAARATAYAVDGGHGNVIVQRMLKPSFSGVLFTRAPDAPGQMLVEVIDGTADDLASGRRTPKAYRFGRLTLAAIGPPPPQDLAPLLHLAERIASHFGKPQDIEWAHADGRFHILQARDIAADMTEKAAGDAAETVLFFASTGSATSPAPSDVIFHTSSMAELLPRPTTLSLDLLNTLWAPGGSVDLAARRLGLAYAAGEGDPPLYTRINGRIVANLHLETSRALRVSSRQRRRLARDAATIADDVRAVLPALRERASLDAALDLTHLTFDELIALWRRASTRFITETHPHAEVVNILAGFAAATASQGHQAAAHGAAWHGALSSAATSTQRDRTDAYRRIAGHRATLDYELAHPRWSEVPGAVEAFVATLKPHNASPPAPAGSLADLTQLKEEAKHEVLRDIAHLRAILRELDHRMGLGGHIFELTLKEVASLSPAKTEAIQVECRKRREAQQRLLLEPAPPARITARDLEQLATPAFAVRNTQHVATDTSDGRCKGRGQRVSGHGEAAGRVYVATSEQAESGLPLDGFRKDDILVTPLVHPDWLGLVLASGGVVADTGGWLSHMAIVAREHGIAMIVGVPNAGQFRTGDRIRLMPDGKVVAENDTASRLTLVAAK